MATGCQVGTTARAVSGAEASERLDRFVDQHLRRTFLQIQRLVRNAADAQDLTQEVFVKVWQRLDQLRDGQKEQSWLSAVARNTAIDFLRRKSRVTFCGDDGLETADHENPERILLRAERDAGVEAGLARLTESERTVLVLKDMEGLESADVARLLGCSKATVRSHVANARVKLRWHLTRANRCR